MTTPIREWDKEQLLRILGKLHADLIKLRAEAIDDADNDAWSIWLRYQDDIERALGYVPGSLFLDL